MEENWTQTPTEEEEDKGQIWPILTSIDQTYLCAKKNALKQMQP